MAYTIIDGIVFIFHKVIFMNLFGWLIRPLYNSVARSLAVVAADVMLIVIELIFYGALLALLVVLCDKLYSKIRRKKRAQKKSESANKAEAPKTEKKPREYREYQ